MLLIIFMVLFLMMLLIFIKRLETSVDNKEESSNVDVIDIEELIKRHGVIISNTPDLEELYADMATPKCEAITVGTVSKKNNYVSVRAWQKIHRGDRAGHTPYKTLRDKRRNSLKNMLEANKAYQDWFEEVEYNDFS